MLTFQDGRLFAQGACSCVIGPLTSSGRDNRITVKIIIESIEEKAVVDTGGVYLVCSAQVSDFLRGLLTDELQRATINIRGGSIKGGLHRLNVTLEADDERGRSLDLEVTAFLPDPGSIPPDLPTILGLHGCLEHIRFAVDPWPQSTFYFGSI